MEVATAAVVAMVVVMVATATTRLLPDPVATETEATAAAEVVDTAAPLARTVTTVDIVVVEGTADARETE